MLREKQLCKQFAWFAVYEAAKEAGLEQAVLDVYEAGIGKHSPVWFAVNAGMDTSAQVAHEDAAITAAMPHLERWLQWSGAEHYARAPIMTPSRWEAFVGRLHLYHGPDAHVKPEEAVQIERAKL
ncbi:hypothetical protein C8R45DRAFT_1101019 [Mycena sanguinolenta]|nr:hypothetical protein C8R45DRAFT_1101019 [Mycena sanguinolenta]